MEDIIYRLTEYLEQVLKDIGVPIEIRSSLIEIFLANNNYSLTINDKSITFDGNAFIIRDLKTGNYIVFNKTHGLMINYTEDNKRYYLDLTANDNYSIQINTDNNGLSHVECYERRPDKCRYSLSEGVYTYSEIKVDSGSYNDRQSLISCVEECDVINEFKRRFMIPLENIFPSLCDIGLINQKSKNKIFYKENKETIA